MVIVRVKIVLITNIVPPYRQRAYGMLASLSCAKGGDFRAICTHHHEPQRDWPILTGKFRQIILPGIKIPLGENRSIAINFGLDRALDDLCPDVLILAGFGPAQYCAHRYARRHTIPTVVQFDGWAQSDRHYQNPIRRCIRSKMITQAKSFIAAGQNGRDWFARFGIADQNILIAPIPPSFPPLKQISSLINRPIDLIWCGRPTRSKGFDRFLAIARDLHCAGTINAIRIIGADHQNAIGQTLDQYGLTGITDLLGHIPPAELRPHYQHAKLCLLPSNNDAYGITAIEAISCGTVVLASDQLGGARDVLAPSEILPLDQPGQPDQLDIWVKTCTRLLRDHDLWQTTQKSQHTSIRHNTPDHHANTLWQACQMATQSIGHL